VWPGADQDRESRLEPTGYRQSQSSFSLFQTDIVDTGIRAGPMSWDISPDGRFLIISETSTDASINVVLNWRAAEPN
jgi:hypothetical protein